MEIFIYHDDRVNEELTRTSQRLHAESSAGVHIDMSA